MTIEQLARHAGDTATRVGRWSLRRAQERSTWIGLAAIAGALGKSVLADHLTRLGDVVPMLLGAGGAALMAASTSPRPTTRL